jgi:glycosyltransferase involved in cell wall biosynthesis
MDTKEKSSTKIICVIPVYNEEEYIESTIQGIKEINGIDSIIVVDDGSSDNTYSKVKRLGVETIKLPKNYGKGYAIKAAIANKDYDYLMLIDGDLGETSKEAYKLLYSVLKENIDVAIAKFPKARKKGGLGLVKGLAKLGVFLYTGKIFNSSLSGQRVYKRKVLEKIDYIPDRFGVEVAMTIGALRNNFKVKEIDVNMRHRETSRDIKGFIHRGKQFFNIATTLILISNRR